MCLGLGGLCEGMRREKLQGYMHEECRNGAPILDELIEITKQ